MLPQVQTLELSSYLRATANSLDRVKRSLLLLGNIEPKMSVNRPEEEEEKYLSWMRQQTAAVLHVIYHSEIQCEGVTWGGWQNVDDGNLSVRQSFLVGQVRQKPLPQKQNVP